MLSLARLPKLKLAVREDSCFFFFFAGSDGVEEDGVVRFAVVRFNLLVFVPSFAASSDGRHLNSIIVLASRSDFCLLDSLFLLDGSRHVHF
jgi:hypothetical protein